LALVACGLAVVTVPARAQDRGFVGMATGPDGSTAVAGGETGCPVPRRCRVDRRASLREGPSPSGSTDGPGPETSFLLSAAIPGAGQYARGQKRWIAYVAAEIAGWYLVLDRRHDGDRLRDRYREIAWSAAREGVSGTPRVDGDFHYYETLMKWAQSGTFDLDPGLEGIQPESDPTTFNGAMWALATDIYFPADGPVPEPGDPIYEEAMAYYVRRAYSDRFLWSWTEGSEEWTRYGETISESDARFREATLFTGLVVANHLLSAVDAFVSAKLGEATDGAVETSVHAVPAYWHGRLETRLDLSLRLNVPGP
jgi:hypothetical protein